jgi:hypothetical protein
MKSFCGLLVVFGFCFIGCTTVIPVTSNINDFVMMGLKTNKQDSVVFEISSNIYDGEITVAGKDGEGTTGKVTVTEGSVLQRMVNEYMTAKFTKMSENGDVKVKIILKDFSLQDYNTQSTGMQVLSAFAGGSAAVRQPRIVTAKIIAVLEINREGQEETKNLISSAEENYVGQFTSEVSNKAVADCINSANNKILMQMNAFFEEIGM